MGRSNTEEEVDFVAECITEAVERFRNISALGR
jgi:cysteine sulfinate desulfinase/cysteine desulfurase-like protein